MKRAFIISLFVVILSPRVARSQESVISEINYAKLEQYIALAKQNYPRKKIFDANEAKAKSGVPLAKVSYLDPLTASYIYRPDNKSSVNALNPYQINGFQFTASLNLGTFIQKPFQVKQAKADYEIAQLENKEYDGMLVNEVKSRYYTYIQQSNDLKVKTQAAQDGKALLDDLRVRFERGEVELDVYNGAKNALSESLSGKMETEVNFLKARDSLEEIIGMPLDAVK